MVINRQTVTKFSRKLAAIAIMQVWTVLVLNVSAIAAPSATTTVARRTAEEQLTIDAYKNASDAVVFITSITMTVDPFELFPEMRPREGTGSGMVVDGRRGIVLTNLHVIKGANKVDIMLANGKTSPAQLIGFDEESDLAVLQLQKLPKSLPSLPFGDSSRLEVGQRVLAIGNPFGLSSTLTTGIISSLDRTLRAPNGGLMRGLIQTDAAINPGNSGGPLLDIEGRLIGINTAILSQSGDSAGIGFAVPINQIRRVLPDLISNGRVLRPRMGWVLVDTTQGPMVRRLIPEGPAEKAGVAPIERMVESIFLRGYTRDLERADLIFKVNGRRVQSSDQVEDLVARATPEKALAFTLRRGGVDGPEREVKIKPVLQ